MSEFEKQKFIAISQIKGLCAHCSNNIPHECKVQSLTNQIENLSGVPLIVNDRFQGLLFT